MLPLPYIGYYSWGTFGNLLYSYTSIPIPGEFKPAPTLTLKVEVEGDGADNPACAGCVSADEAK